MAEILWRLQHCILSCGARQPVSSGMLINVGKVRAEMVCVCWYSGGNKPGASYIGLGSTKHNGCSTESLNRYIVG